MTLPDSPNGESVDAEVAKAALVREARGIISVSECVTDRFPSSKHQPPGDQSPGR
jgi:hypothetical protein